MEWNNKIKDQLQDLEVTPPDDCWNVINHNLQKEKTIPLVSPYAKVVSWIKYSAAAVIAGIILITAFNAPFRNSIQKAIMGPSLKASIVDTTPKVTKDTINFTDTIR